MSRDDLSPFDETALFDAQSRDESQHVIKLMKMEALAQLSSGIAHDFNNVLSGIIGYSELATQMLEKDHPVHEYLRIIIRQADSAAEFVQRLLVIGQHQSDQSAPLDINATIRQFTRFIRRYLGEDIRLQLDLASDVRPINGQISAIEQILTNLCINARDAMPDGGSLLIKTRNIERIISLPGEHTAARSNSGYVKLSIEDSGIGMPRETLENIYKPYYTTKSPGHGTGLGLANVHQLITEYHGFLNCTSELGRGTAFDIYLPALTSSQQAAPQAQREPVRGGSETILLVEDNVDLLSGFALSLEKYGYKILSARNGVQALNKLEMLHDEVDLVVSDAVMPEMGGVELQQHIADCYPHVQFMLMSGCPEKIDPEMDILAKPFRLEELARRVRNMLDHQSASPDGADSP